MKVVITEHMSDKEIVMYKKERLKNLKVIQEKADVETYGGRTNRFIHKGRPMKPTIRNQKR